MGIRNESPHYWHVDEEELITPHGDQELDDVRLRGADDLLITPHGDQEPVLCVEVQRPEDLPSLPLMGIRNPPKDDFPERF